MLIYVQITAGGSSLAGSFNIDLFINKQTNKQYHAYRKYTQQTGCAHVRCRNKDGVEKVGVEKVGVEKVGVEKVSEEKEGEEKVGVEKVVWKGRWCREGR